MILNKNKDPGHRDIVSGSRTSVGLDDDSMSLESGSVTAVEAVKRIAPQLKKAHPVIGGRRGRLWEKFGQDGQD